MATRNFVPRTGSEGQIGTTVKPWDKVIAITSSFSVHSGSITGDELTLISGSVTSTGSFGHLLVGGNMVVGNISASADSTGSFGRLEIAGNSSLTGDVTIGGNINIGDADTDSLTIAADLTSNLVPNADSTFNIGSTAKNWKIGHIEQVSSTNITASSDISSSGNIFGTNLLADSSSVSTRLTAITSSISGLKTNSGSFSTRVTNLKADSGSFSTRVTAITSSISGLKTDSGSFSTRITDLVGGSTVFFNITASNNISASGTIFASKFESAGASGETISFNDNLNITGDITASGNISASGDIRSDGRIFEQDTSVIDHATAMAIVFGG